MTSTIYSILKEGFNQQPDKTRLQFNNPQLEITADKIVNKKGPLDLTEVWFRIIPSTPITTDQINSAISLFSTHSQYVAGGFTYYTAIKKKEFPLPLNQIASFYISKHEQLRTLSDHPPKTSINDKILDGPVTVPPHLWGSVYCAFEDTDPKSPECGYSWNSIVLYQNAIALRIAKQANFIHSLSPTLADIVQQIDDTGDIEFNNALKQVVPFSLEQDKVTSEQELFQRLSNTPQPLILGKELEDIAAYTSNMMGVDISSLKYELKSSF